MYKHAKSTRTYARDIPLCAGVDYSVDYKIKLLKMVELNIATLAAYKLLRSESEARLAVPLVSISAKKIMQQKLQGGIKHLTNLGYTTSQIKLVPEWFFMSADFIQAVKNVRRAYENGNPVPKELLVLCKPLGFKPREASPNYTNKKSLSADELSPFGEALSSALGKKRELK